MNDMAGASSTPLDESEDQAYGYVRYEMLPEHMQDGTRRYIEKGTEPGGFLYAVLCNKLVDAYGKADTTNTYAMPVWASWLWNECPAAAWGSEEKVARWINKHATIEENNEDQG
jgi:hypothetical protein